MLCKQCGFGLGNKANFCPSCGYKVTEEDRLEVQPRSNPAKWLKILSGIILAGLITIFLAILFSDNMTEVISEQLKAVKEDRLTEAYYGYTSKTFRDGTSLEQFKTFMGAYPVFSKNESVRFVDRNSEDDRGTLKAMIMDAKGIEIPVFYQLVKEDDQWHIENIKLIEPTKNPLDRGIDSLKKGETFDSKPIEEVIQKQIQLIRGHDLKKAYEDYTSVDFRKNTTADEFEAFVKNNPNFANSISMHLYGLSFDNNMATMSGTMKQANGAVDHLEYDLVQENGKWKIFHVKMIDSDMKGSELVFSKFAVGTTVNAENLVNTPQTVLDDKSEDIYFNLHVDGIKAGTEINVVFEHLDSHSKIDPVSKRVSEDGSVILTFIFSPPAGGWPKGNYRLLVTSSSGETGSYDFKIEE